MGSIRNQDAEKGGGEEKVYQRQKKARGKKIKGRPDKRKKQMGEKKLNNIDVKKSGMHLEHYTHVTEPGPRSRKGTNRETRRYLWLPSPQKQEPSGAGERVGDRNEAKTLTGFSSSQKKGRRVPRSKGRPKLC